MSDGLDSDPSTSAVPFNSDLDGENIVYHGDKTTDAYNVRVMFSGLSSSAGSSQPQLDDRTHVRLRVPVNAYSADTNASLRDGHRTKHALPSHPVAGTVRAVE